MSDLISRQVLDLWNRYKPTIAVDAIEYDRELKQLLSTNLAEVGTDAISREQAIDAVKERYYKYGRFAKIEELVWSIEKLPPIQSKRGKWINIVDGVEYTWGTCNKCGAKIPMAYKYYEFCPHCGMKNEVDNEIN